MKLILLALVLVMSAQLEAQKQSADFIFIHGDIYTGAVLPYMPGAKAPSAQRVQAIAVKDGKIIAIGTNDEIKKFHTKTKAIDLGGHFVMPGFNDAHLHLANAGFEKLNVNLVGAKSLAEMQDRIATGAKTTSSGQWILGRGWDHTTWPGQKLPTRQDLDKATGDHPAYFVRVTDISASPTSGAESGGRQQGRRSLPRAAQRPRRQWRSDRHVRESAQNLITSKEPPPSATQRRRGLELAFQDVGSARHHLGAGQFPLGRPPVMEEMELQGALPVRVSEWLNFHDPVETLQEHRAHHTQTDSMLHTGMLKGYMDGSLGSRTAALLAPYADDAHNTGLPQYKQDELNDMADKRVRAGFQLGFHAIGDAAAEMALQSFAYAERGSARTSSASQDTSQATDDFRFRIEHDQVVTAEQVPRYAQLGVIASSAAEPPAHRHELGGRTHRRRSRQALLSMGRLREEQSHARVRNGLSRRADHAFPRHICLCYAQE